MEQDVLYDDKTLFEQIAESYEHGFRIFFNRYQTKVYYFILSIVKNQADAEELTQDVFMRLWVSRKALLDIDNPSNYLHVMARNRALDHIKKLGSERKMRSQLGEDVDQNYTEQDIIFRECRSILNEAINQLPTQQQKVYRLCREAGLSRQEVADQLNISPNTVKNHLAEALGTIRNYMRGQDRMILLILLTPILGN